MAVSTNKRKYSWIYRRRPGVGVPGAEYFYFAIWMRPSGTIETTPLDLAISHNFQELTPDEEANAVFVDDVNSLIYFVLSSYFVGLFSSSAAAETALFNAFVAYYPKGAAYTPSYLVTP